MLTVIPKFRSTSSFVKILRLYKLHIQEGRNNSNLSIDLDHNNKNDNGGGVHADDGENDSRE